MKNPSYLILFCGVFLLIGFHNDLGMPLTIASDTCSTGNKSCSEKSCLPQTTASDTHKHDHNHTIDQNCEHNVPAIECDDCRHEVGVVKVDDEFLKSGGMLELAEVKASTLGSIMEAPGVFSTNPNREAHIAPRIPGVIKEVYKRLGDKVKAGEIVAVLDSIELGRAKADYLKAKAMMELSGKNFDRVRRLHEKEIVSQKTFIEADSEHERARIELRSLEEHLHLLGLRDEDIEEIHGHEKVQSLLPITAPIDGTVIEKHAVIGERVDPSVSFFRIADLSRLWVWFDAYEKDLAKIKVGQDVSLSIPAYPDKRFKGQVSYIGDLVSEKTRTTKVLAEIDNPAMRLKPGMFVTVSLHLEGTTGSIVVPKDAVQSDGNEKIVFVPLKDHYFIKKEVVLGTVTRGYYEVLSGLESGQKVVTKGSFLLKSELQKEKFGEGCVH